LAFVYGIIFSGYVTTDSTD